MESMVLNLLNIIKIVFLLFDIFRSLIKSDSLDDLKPLFVQVELYLLCEDFTPIIEYAEKKN